jgi:hypothetical protein
LLLPGGFSQLYYAGRDRFLRWVAKRRGIHVPSLVADSRVAVPAVELDDGQLAADLDRASELIAVGQ